MPESQKPRVFISYSHKDETALNTADVAILLISADFLTSKFIRGEEIPRLLKRREQEGIRVIPLIIKPCPWKKVAWLNAMQGASRDNVELSGLSEHEQNLILCKLVEKIHDLIHVTGSGSSSTTPTIPIHSDRLPTVKGGFFGRVAELQLLNDAWSSNTTRIIQFIAPGGTGKTKLLRHWLDQTHDIPVLIAWSFYSQGSSENKQTSATPFFSHAFENLGSSRERFASEEEKGEHLAELLRGKRYVLVLDGLEPLQHGGAAMRGELKDKAIRQLLCQLARHPHGLCIITTRIAVHELSDRAAPTVIRHDLQNLCEADGVALLQSLGVKGKAEELGKAVHEYGGHALALSLLGNVLRLRHQGDVRKRDTLKVLVKATGNRDSRHAFKVMQAYAEWLAGEPELALLHLLGLFDHPIGQEVLQMLWDAQIPHLTAGIDEDEWLEAIASLREEHHLLSQHDSGGDLDCHPLIREYFGKQLQTQQPQAWQQAHERLYDYYQALPEKEFPDTLEEMQPLFSAVAHGCAAGLHQQALEEVYWPRILRGDQKYVWKKLGAFSDDLCLVAYFFNTLWRIPILSLSDSWQAALLNWAGFHLCALGRLCEALDPIQTSIKVNTKLENWKGLADNTRRLSELQLALGDMTEAQTSSEHSLNYAERSRQMFQRITSRTTYAHILHQVGKTTDALLLFQEAEQFQQEEQPNYPYLYSLSGFRYCDLLLTQHNIVEVIIRVMETLNWAELNKESLLDICLQYLTLGRAYLQQLQFPNLISNEIGGIEQTTYWLVEAVDRLRKAGTIDYLPFGLISRAELYRYTQRFSLAHQDLQEVFEIAKSSGMRLHLTDYHLEMARLLLAEEETPPNLPLSGEEQDTAATVVQECTSPDKGKLGGGSLKGISYHLTAAERLINETGYHRRDKELAELKQHSA
jgi:tetratricopeptide (TPR) repeat protein